MLRRRSSYQPALATSMWALTISVTALVATLFNTTLRPPCEVKLLGPGTDAAAAAGLSATDRILGIAAPLGALGGPAPGGAGAGAAHALRGAPLPAAAGAPPHQTLSFQVCNGFANQRLALIYGLVIAKQLGRAAVLPTLILDGTQLTDAARLASDDRAATATFDAFYDAAALRAALATHGVRALTQAEFDALPGASAGGAAASLAAARPVSDVPRHFAAHHGADHLALDCPLFKLAPALIQAEHKFIWSVLSALRPAAALAPHVARAMASVKGKPFNFLHIRLEKDWQAHCSRWAALSAVDGIVRDNCWNNTLDVHKAMTSMGFQKDVPVYVAAHWAGADGALVETVLAGIGGAGFTAVKAQADEALPRELRALVEYEVAMRAGRYLGNSVSTFSALAILQRRQAGLWAGYYNGGDVPLVQVLPLFSTPWVFTFNSWSRGYEPMLKASVNSALKAGGVSPHCVFAGNMSDPVVGWMRRRGVRVIHHDPAWRPALVALARGKAAGNLAQSHLFASEDSIVGTWQRIDLPLVEWLDQYTYVLFTDTDVLFRRGFSFHEFPLPLPRAVGMGPEMVDMFPYNAGVMLANLPALRDSYPAFLEFILSNQYGLTFPGFGPGDQGAYNQFYEADVRQWRLPSKFNAKPYHSSEPQRMSDAAIVHFHGPKPADYLEYATTGACPKFGDMCKAGVAARACMYVHEWVRRLEGDDATAAYDKWRAGCAKA
ncbi:MAG: hypothetical protein J3K34DRAFT_381683 [Monoraphidium minutum]|nr:MAG: hypothetical protein J3K34DRAFT_381683 [Monoraphidium minutum]